VLRTPLDASSYESVTFGAVSYLTAIAVYNEQEGALTLFAVNRSPEKSMELSCDLRSFEGFMPADHIILDGPDPKAYNSADQQNVVPRRGTLPAWENGRCSVILSPLSWNVLRFSKVD
jgi:alpha-N-arabinofuranosidase